MNTTTRSLLVTLTACSLAACGAPTEDTSDWKIEEPEESPNIDPTPEPSPEPTPDPEPSRPIAEPTPCVFEGPTLEDVLEAAPTSDEATLRGTLCNEEDALWAILPAKSYLQFERFGELSDDVMIRVHGLGERGELELLENALDRRAFWLGEEESSRVHSFDTFPHDVFVIEVRPVAEVETPVDLRVAPYVSSDDYFCPNGGSYTYDFGFFDGEAAAPTTLTGSLCHRRDTMTWSLRVEAGKTVTITLENPESITDFDLGLTGLKRSRCNYNERDLSLIEEEMNFTMGMAGHHSISFTPIEDGIVGLRANLGISLGEPMRLRVD